LLLLYNGNMQYVRCAEAITNVKFTL